MARYVKVAKLDDLPPGSCREFQADGKPVALFNVNGAVFALDNTSCIVAARWARACWKKTLLRALGMGGSMMSRAVPS